MKRINTLIVLVSALSLQFSINAQDVFVSDKLEKKWEVNEGLDIPESSHFNKFDNCIYVSNIVGKHDIKDGIAYISKLNSNGEYISEKWITGLNAPKGIACSKEKLYVTDIDRVLEIELKTGKIIKEYKNVKSQSLNDVVVAVDGRVFVSDSKGDCIFKIGKDSLELVLQSDELSGMNGIYTIGNLLYLGSKGNFISVNTETKEIKTLAKNVGYLDGIELVAENTFVTSDWGGTVQLIIPGVGVEKLLDTKANNVNAADVGYISSQKLLLVPTFLDNKIIAYKLKLK